MGYKVYWRKAFDSVRKAEYRLKRAKKLQQHFPHQVWTGVVADAEEQLYIAKLNLQRYEAEAAMAEYQ
jgi:hypothetical protein